MPGASRRSTASAIKELWRVRPEVFEAGLVKHTMGWPLDNRTGGGSFLYHYGEDTMAVGFVVHLNYKNPHLDPYREFQRFKRHPVMEEVLDGATREGYGARAIAEGGWQSVPRLAFPGGCLVGCAAGFVNVPRIKGNHNAILTGMMAADHIAAALAEGRANDVLEAYEAGWALVRRRAGPLPPYATSSRCGRGSARSAVSSPAVSTCGPTPSSAPRSSAPWAMAGPDYAQLKPGRKTRSIDYPKPDGVVTFDRNSSVYLSNTNHEEDQPVHLKVLDPALQKSSELGVYDGPSPRYCPAGVYEWELEGSEPRYVINAQNCVHCKTCDIKDPNQNINWVTPVRRWRSELHRHVRHAAYASHPVAKERLWPRDRPPCSTTAPGCRGFGSARRSSCAWVR